MSFEYSRIGTTNTCTIIGLLVNPLPGTTLIVPPSDPVTGFLIVGITSIQFQVNNVGLNLSEASNLKTISNNACEGTVMTGSLVIPNDVTSIGESAFKGCGFTGTLTLSTKLQTIGTSAFENCTFTGSLTIPISVTNIGDFAFNNSGFDGGELIFEGANVIPCFTETCNIRLDTGYTCIKDVKEGDMVIGVITNTAITVKKVGYRDVDTTIIEKENRPYVIPEKFFGIVPHKEVIISGHHRILFKSNDKYVGINTFKVPGLLPLEQSVKTTRYYHIELETYDGVFVDGVPVETLRPGEFYAFF